MGPVEERLGFAFPGDFKELLSTFGTGLFAGLVQVICPARHEAGFVDEMNRTLQRQPG